MYTASDIRNVQFTKNMGGYKIAEVEAFVEACADTVEALTAEKEELTKKLGILADKLVEYRRDEDSIRSALLSAQRTGDAIIREANEEAATVVEAAKREAEAIVSKAKGSIGHYEAEIARLKSEVSDFKAGLLTMYKEHITLLKSIPSEYEGAAAPAQETVVAPPAPAEEPAPVAVAEEPAPAVVEEEEEPMKIVPEQPKAPETPQRSKFANLKFGEDYNLDDDQDD